MVMYLAISFKDIIYTVNRYLPNTKTSLINVFYKRPLELTLARYFSNTSCLSETSILNKNLVVG